MIMTVVMIRILLMMMRILVMMMRIRLMMTTTTWWPTPALFCRVTLYSRGKKTGAEEKRKFKRPFKIS